MKSHFQFTWVTILLFAILLVCIPLGLCALQDQLVVPPLLSENFCKSIGEYAFQIPFFIYISIHGGL
jgi:hypothetical protein